MLKRRAGLAFSISAFVCKKGDLELQLGDVKGFELKFGLLHTLEVWGKHAFYGMIFVDEVGLGDLASFVVRRYTYNNM